MAKWYVDDGWARFAVMAATGREAAEDYVLEGDWGESATTRWVTVRVWQEDASGERVHEAKHKVELPPDVPACRGGGGDAHQWEHRGEVRGSGGGVMVTDVCARCRLRRHLDTWGRDSSDGEEGLEAVTYEPFV